MRFYAAKSVRINQKQKAKRRLKLIEEVVKEGKSVSQVCKAYGISRQTYYRWKSRYDQCTTEEGLKSLEDRVNTKRYSRRHPRQVPKKYEQLILNLVLFHPEYSVRGLSEHLPLDNNGKSIVGYHGVQRILERNNLSTFKKRLALSNSLRVPGFCRAELPLLNQERVLGKF